MEGKEALEGNPSRKEEGLVGKDMGERIKSPRNTREGLEQQGESEMKLCHETKINRKHLYGGKGSAIHRQDQMNIN